MRTFQAPILAGAGSHLSLDGWVDVQLPLEASGLPLGRESVVLDNERCILAVKERFIVPERTT